MRFRRHDRRELTHLPPARRPPGPAPRGRSVPWPVTVGGRPRDAAAPPGARRPRGSGTSSGTRRATSTPERHGGGVRQPGGERPRPALPPGHPPNSRSGGPTTHPGRHPPGRTSGRPRRPATDRPGSGTGGRDQTAHQPGHRSVHRSPRRSSPPTGPRTPAASRPSPGQPPVANRQARLTTIATTTVRKTRRMNSEPRRLASNAPDTLPARLQSAITRPSPHSTLPAGMK